MLRERFEDLNVVRKYDAIVMNPPFGAGGKTAIEHLAKAARHLRNGGRIVALLPTGPSADKRFAAWQESDAAKGIHLVADIKMPAVLFERAGTSAATRVVVLEKQTDAEVAARLQQTSRDYAQAASVRALFDRIEDVALPARLEPRSKDAATGVDGLSRVTVGGVDLELRGDEQARPATRLGSAVFARLADAARAEGGGWRRAEQAFVFPDEDARRRFLDRLAKPEPAAGEAAGEAVPGVGFKTGETRHARTGAPLFVASFSKRESRDVYERVAAAAKRHDGYYSSYDQRGAIPGFQFSSAAARQAFLDEVQGKPAADAGGARYSRFGAAGAIPGTGPGRPFFSALTRGIEAVGQAQAPAAQWLGMLKGLQGKGVKAEEIAWSGVEDWLAQQAGPVSKDALLDYLHAGEVRVEEVTKGGGLGERQAAYDERLAAIEAMPTGGHYSLHAERAAPADPKLRRLNHFEDGGAAAGTDRAIFNIQPLTPAVEQAQPGALKLAAADPQQLKQRLRAIFKQMAPNADLAFVDGLVDGQAVGKFEPLRQLVTLSLNYGEPEVTLRHEVIHVLREAGLITDAEWATLQRAVRGSEGLREAERLYPDAGREVQVEEAIAQMFGEYRAGAPMLPRYRRIFARVRDLLTRLGNALRGLGFNSVDAIFARIESGEVGRRDGEGRLSAEALARQTGPGTHTPEFRNWFGDSKVVDAEGKPLRVYHGTLRDFEAFDTSQQRGLINHRLGAHFAVDPRVTDAFTLGPYARDANGNPRDGGQVLSGYLNLRDPYTVPQRQDANGSMASDQAAFAVDAMRTVFPARPELLRAWMGYIRPNLSAAEVARAADDVLANRLTDAVQQFDIRPEYVEKRDGDVLQTLAENFPGDFGPAIDGQDWTQAIADAYREALQAQGYDGIRYTNTSPNETKREGPAPAAGPERPLTPPEGWKTRPWHPPVKVPVIDSDFSAAG